MQLTYKIFFVALGLAANITYAHAEHIHPSTILNIKMNATYLDIDPDKTGHSSIKLMPAVRLTLSTPHSCGTSQVHITPDSIGVPVENFLGEIVKIKNTQMMEFHYSSLTQTAIKKYR